MTNTVISQGAVDRRRYWVSEIVSLLGTFGEDASRVELELTEETQANGVDSIIDHLRLCGAIPESYRHDSSEEKLYSKYTDALLAVAFRSIGLASLVLVERGDAADVEVVGQEYSFVADAKAFRLSRTAKNQKDFKVQAMHGWKRGKPFAIVVCPLYQMPSSSSQIYQQASAFNVCLLSFSHLAVLLSFSRDASNEAAQRLLGKVLKAVEATNPSKNASAYWSAINRTFLDTDTRIGDLWQIEKAANLEAVAIAKEEGLEYLARQREDIMRLSHEEAVRLLIEERRIDSRMRVIASIRDNGLLNFG